MKSLRFLFFFSCIRDGASLDTKASPATMKHYDSALDVFAFLISLTQPSDGSVSTIASFFHRLTLLHFSRTRLPHHRDVYASSPSERVRVNRHPLNHNFFLWSGLLVHGYLLDIVQHFLTL